MSPERVYVRSPIFAARTNSLDLEKHEKEILRPHVLRETDAPIRFAPLLLQPRGLRVRFE
jgi:hypothetical protein